MGVWFSSKLDGNQTCINVETLVKYPPSPQVVWMMPRASRRWFWWNKSVSKNTLIAIFLSWRTSASILSKTSSLYLSVGLFDGSSLSIICLLNMKCIIYGVYLLNWYLVISFLIIGGLWIVINLCFCFTLT